jgi:peptidoglycan/LPS O-acetylase OafA/YrhL
MKVKKGFFRALRVFFLFVIGALVLGYVYENMQLAATIGVGLGVLWMGVAYFNAEEGEEEE